MAVFGDIPGQVGLPGITTKTGSNIPEVLASLAGLTMRGITLAGNLGVLKAGAILYRTSTSTDANPIYTNVISGNGAAVGVLRWPVDTGTAGGLGMLIVAGAVKRSVLVDPTGAAYAAGTPFTQVLTDLGAVLKLSQDMVTF